MTSEAINPDDRTLNGRVVPAAGDRPVHLCHHGCDCWQKNFDRYVRTTPERPPDQLDNVEAHALLEAKNRAARLVRRHVPELAAGRKQVIGACQAAESALAELSAQLEAGTLGTAARDLGRVRERRISTDTPPRPRWLRSLAWLTAIAAGGVDAWYFRSIFQVLVGNLDITLPGEIVTLFPGLIITAGLLAAGTTLGKALHRAARSEAGREARRRGVWRLLVRLGSWALHLLLPAMLLLVGLVWSVQRTREANARSAGLAQLPLPVDFVAILIVTLTLCALVLKVIAYDPYSAAETDARRRMRTARRRTRRLLRAAERRVTGHALAWSDLCALRDDLVSGIAERYGDAYRLMMYARGFHEKAGSIPPEFAQGERGTSLRERIGPELAGVTGPEPEFGGLRQVEETIDRYRPDANQPRLHNLREALAVQLSAAAPPSPAPPSPRASSDG
ncbi:hypothetical protein [Spongiactinospora sp. 9N601]|uniref:hypothetical protein n=1 Tax=Spongiactinospora sp. 9N601 TaxID=3375149 RepID=UPI00379E0774